MEKESVGDSLASSQAFVQTPNVGVILTVVEITPTELPSASTSGNDNTYDDICYSHKRSTRGPESTRTR